MNKHIYKSNLELQPYNVKNHYNIIYQKNRGVNKKLYFKELLDTIEKFNPKSILEIGCGNGCYLYMIQQYFPDIRLYGVDHAEEGIEIAKKNVNGIFKTTDARKTYLNNNSIDMVISVYSLFSMRYILRDVIKEMYRVCKKYLVLFEPFFCQQNIFGKYHIIRSEYAQGIPFYVQDNGFDIIHFGPTNFYANRWKSKIGILIAKKKNQDKFDKKDKVYG